MARRLSTPEPGPNGHVNQETVKVKEEKSKGKQRAHVEEEESVDGHNFDANGEDEDAPGEEDEDVEESPRAKRRRTNVEGDSAPSGSGSGSGSHVKRENVKTLPRGEDGYIPGSIVRIQLQNFVTYDFVEFYPGTHLNMIIGPNGTGKSSIACAIALGLNFPAGVLGRATEIGSFVKNGEEKGYIEIELKGPNGKRNYVIRRHLKSGSKTTSFTLNGSPASGNEIKNKMAELNVQVGNLCSFLPQDRVSEFAAMSPQQLLRETQRAAGDENLTHWHDILINAGKDIRELQQKIKDEESTLNQLKERNEGIERDVQRYKDRKKIEHSIGLLNVLVPVAEYRESRVKFVEMKARQRKLHARVQALKKKNEPAHELLQKMEQDVRDLDKKRDSLKAATQSKFRQLNEKNNSSDKLERESIETIDKLIALKDEEINRQKQIKALANEVRKLEEEVAKPPPPNLSSEDELLAQTRQINLERQGVLAERAEFDMELKSIIEKNAAASVNLNAARNELEKLASADNQKLSKMASWDRTTYEAILWVRQNRHLFKMEVYETPFMRVTMKDMRFTDAVEATIGGGMKTFVTECQEDCDTLNRLVNDGEMFGKHKKITTWFRADLPHLHHAPPMTEDELKQENFDGYAMDFLDFPRGLGWFLENQGLHRTAIALDGRKVDVNKVMQLVGRPTANHPGGATFYAGRTANVVTRSRYGQKALSNATRDIGAARNLVIPTIDLDAQKRVQEAIKVCENEISIYDGEKARVNRKIDAIGAADNEFRLRMDDIKRRREEVKNESKRLQSAKSKLKTKSETLSKLRKEPPTDEKRKALKAKLKVNALKRAKFAKEYTDLVHAIIHEQGKCTEAGLRYLQVSANKAALQELCSRKDKKYEETLVQFHEVDRLFKEVKANSKVILEKSRDILDESTDEVKEEYAQLETARMQWDAKVKQAKLDGRPPPSSSAIDNRTVEQLKEELETQIAKLEMNLNTNPGVVEQYEKRKKDIAQLETTIEDRKRKEAKIAKEIKTARDNWHPALQSLVNRIGEKFSAAFDRIGCAGEIRISEDEDYEKWAIDILVKFRVSERLQLLTAHRQSGGERSLTTILYLLSLTEEARAPFSLVDEINQGMDQRAERAVHNSMVNVTCQADSAQYFLITPKLLADLDYDDRMKILCVNNGEWLPDVSEEGGGGNMMAMIDTYVSSRA